MTTEITKFGDGISTTRVAEVSNRFGAVESGKTVGVVKTEGSTNEGSFTIDGDMASAGTFALQTNFVLPAGAIVKNVYLEVKEAFVLGGTSPTILFGTEASEATNGFVISEAQAEATGSYDLTSTLTGTWASPLAADTTVGLAMGGTSPTSTSAGKAKVIVEYVSVGAV